MSQHKEPEKNRPTESLGDAVAIARLPNQANPFAIAAAREMGAIGNDADVSEMIASQIKLKADGDRWRKGEITGTEFIHLMLQSAEQSLERVHRVT